MGCSQSKIREQPSAVKPVAASPVSRVPAAIEPVKVESVAAAPPFIVDANNKPQQQNADVEPLPEVAAPSKQVGNASSVLIDSPTPVVVTTGTFQEDSSIVESPATTAAAAAAAPEEQQPVVAAENPEQQQPAEEQPVEVVAAAPPQKPLSRKAKKQANKAAAAKSDKEVAEVAPKINNKIIAAADITAAEDSKENSSPAKVAPAVVAAPASPVRQALRSLGTQQLQQQQSPSKPATASHLNALLFDKLKSPPKQSALTPSKHSGEFLLAAVVPGSAEKKKSVAFAAVKHAANTPSKKNQQPAYKKKVDLTIPVLKGGKNNKNSHKKGSRAVANVQQDVYLHMANAFQRTLTHADHLNAHLSSR